MFTDSRQESLEAKVRDEILLLLGDKIKCAAHIGMGGVKIKKEPCQRDEYVYRIS